MREKITKNRKYILMVLGILILVTFNIGMRYLATRPRYKTLPEVTLRNKESNKKGYAVMVSNDSGDGYVEYTSEDGKWPSEEEDYEFKEAKCIDNNGQLVEGALTFADGKASLTTSQTVYCTLYFDKNVGRAPMEVLRENDPQNKLSSETVGGMYRYQGKNTDTINNYICFGTNKKEDCACTDNNTCDDTKLDKYMYRIIGITESGQLYLIKMKGVEEGSNKAFSWGCHSNWNETYLFLALNGESSDNNIFVNNTRYNYMEDGDFWYEIVEPHNWKFGVMEMVSRGSDAYKAVEAFSSTAPAKIGLMYLYDYYLAYDNERNWSSDYDTSNWIHFVNNKNTTGSDLELVLPTRANHEPISLSDGIRLLSNENTKPEDFDSRCSSSSYMHDWVIHIASRGSVDGGYNSWYIGLVRPTFYLSSTLKIKSGTGSITDPYILNIK